MLQGLPSRWACDEDKAAAFADAILDWRDDNQLKRDSGAEDRDYGGDGAGAARAPPTGRSRNPAELRYLLTVDRAAAGRCWRRYVTVYSGAAEPEPRKATAEVRQAMQIARGLSRTGSADEEAATAGPPGGRNRTAKPHGRRSSGGRRAAAGSGSARRAGGSECRRRTAGQRQRGRQPGTRGRPAERRRDAVARTAGRGAGANGRAGQPAEDARPGHRPFSWTCGSPTATRPRPKPWSASAGAGGGQAAVRRAGLDARSSARGVVAS